MKKKYFTIILLLAIQFTFAQIVNIPDVDFKNVLITFNCADFDGDLIPDGDADTNNDGEIDVSEASAILGLHVDSNSINSLEGIASFTNIRFITCINNNLTQLDLSQNLSLERLECRSNNLIDLDVSVNTNLNYLDANFNDLTSLIVGTNTNLERIFCADNNLATINLTQVPNLKRLSASFNEFQTLDITNNFLLEDLFCQGNQLTTINLYSNPNLDLLDITSNQLSSLDVSQNPLLETLSCAFNDLTFLDLSTNTNLITIFCRDNLLNSLDVKNGTNSIVVSFNAINNPNLTCINVDNAVYSQNQSSWAKDAIASYDTNCFVLSIDDYNTTTNTSMFPNPTTGSLQIESTQIISQATVYNLVGQLVKTLKMQTNQKSIDISDLQTGSYLINLQSTSGNSYTKLIVKK